MAPVGNGDELAGGDGPLADCAVRRGGDNPGPVRGISDRPQLVGVPEQIPERGAAGCVPQACGRVFGSGGDLTAVRAEGQRVNVTAMADENGPDFNLLDGPMFTDAGGNLIGIDQGGIGFTNPTTQKGTTRAPLDPLLGPLQNNGGPLLTELPLPGSPVINKGVIANIPPGTTTDERGFLRIVGPGVDVGATEFQPAATTLTLMSSVNPVVPGQPVTFTATVTPQGPGPNNGPTGSVTFRAGGVTLGTVPLVGGVATLTTTALPLGNDAVTATYNGDLNFTPHATTLTETVNFPTIPSATVPAGTILSPPFGNQVSFLKFKTKHGTFLLVINHTGSDISGRLVLLGLMPKDFRTGLMFLNSPALDVFLPHNGVASVKLPNKMFTPAFVAGF
jgi:Bacterial Ig-like domain (group 3)